MKSSLILAAIAGLALASSALAQEDGFVSLFNGKNLDGWEGNPELWSVRDGAITGETKAEPKLTHNTFLVWKGGTVEDFELRLSYRIVKGNSGIQYRSKVLRQGAQGPVVGGYQADFEAGTTYSGILYEEQGRGILAQRGQKTRVVTDGAKHKVEVAGSVGDSKEIQAAIKHEDWNDYVVIAQGNHLIHRINGKTTVDVTDEDAARAAKSGALALQIHVGPPMVVQFKNVRIKKLGPAQAGVGDLDQLQGEWVGSKGYRDDQAVPEEWVQSLRLKFQGEKYDIAWTDGGDGGSVKLKSDTEPKQMDIRSNAAGDLEGIYEIRDGQLRIAYGIEGSGRPKKFEGVSGNNSLIITYRRK